MLEVEGLTTRYGQITAIRDLALFVAPGEVVAVIGPNGAGKTTLLSTVAGLLRPAAGRVRFDGHDVTGLPPDRMLRLGIALVPERRRIFTDLTVEENLLIGGVTSDGTARRRRVGEMCELFPILGERRSGKAGYLSGGEAQQLAIARALMSEPRLLLMDEPALGLAPTLVDFVLHLVGQLRERGITIVVVEQNVQKVLRVVDRAYVMRTGQVAEQGAASDLLAREDLFSAYLGSGDRP